MVHLALEVESEEDSVEEAGYRMDCRNIPFTDVLYINRDTEETAWFSKQIQEPITMSGLGYDTVGSAAGLFNAHGVASTSWNYQLNICDQSWMWVGLMMTGYTNCWKRCGNWCGDTSSPYFRTDGDTGTNYNGVSFNENGHRNVSYKTISVGIR